MRRKSKNGGGKTFMKFSVEYDDITIPGGAEVELLDSDVPTHNLIAYQGDHFVVDAGDLETLDASQIPPRRFVCAETILILYPDCDLTRVPSRQTPDGAIQYDPIEAMLISTRPVHVETAEPEEAE
jgi:hypothetical protein